MLKFTRNKLVSVHRRDDDTLVASGILEDDIYGLEVEVALSLSGLEILSVGGAWKRTENAECFRAIPFLQDAVGFRMDEDFTQRVQKIVGRRSCRHFADILLECCYAARDAAEMMGGMRAHGRDAGQGRPPAPPGSAVSVGRGAGGSLEERPRPGKEKPFGGMIIDLHAHTSPASPCSSVTVEALIAEAKRIGLDGICLTDHNHVWAPGAVADLRQRHGYLVLRGNEITTDQGDMVVFGLEEEIKGIIKLEELSGLVEKAGGFMVVAHPFRGFLTFGVGKLGLTPEKAMERELFKHVDAVEVLNSKVTEKENQLAREVAQRLELPMTGGSDAHEPSTVGVFATRFSEVVEDEKGLLQALRGGKYEPVAFR